MNQKIFGVVNRSKSYDFVEIFGYDTRGIPGVEIIGLGKRSRQLKEKIIFLCRKWRMEIPHKRYVICLENAERWEKEKGFDWRDLELPLFIMYLSLAGKIPLARLDNCFCGGKVAVNGQIKSLAFPIDFLQTINKRAMVKDRRVIALSDNCHFDGSHLHIIPLKEILDSQQLNRKSAD